MPNVNIDIPGSVGGGDDEMANGTGEADLSYDVSQLVLEGSMEAHTEQMHEARGNASSSDNIVRHSAARKFNQEDPIEAAAAEMILDLS